MVCDRSKHSVELTFWKYYLEELTLRRLAQDYPRHVRSDAWCIELDREPATRLNRRTKAWDRDDTPGAVCMGAGVRVDVDAEDDVGWDAVLKTMRASRTATGEYDYRTLHWPVGHGDGLDNARAAGDVHVTLFARARLRNLVDLGSCADSAQYSSGRWVYHHFAGNRYAHICRIEHILKIEGNNMTRYRTGDNWRIPHDVPQPLRFAICTTWTSAHCDKPGPGVSVLPGIDPELLRVTNLHESRAQPVYSAVNLDYLTEVLATRLPSAARGQASQEALFMRTGKGVGAW